MSGPTARLPGVTSVGLQHSEIRNALLSATYKSSGSYINRGVKSIRAARSLVAFDNEFSVLS